MYSSESLIIYPPTFELMMGVKYNQGSNQVDNHNGEQRYMGYVRFYDSKKKFGIVVTNANGLKPNSPDSQRKELFFGNGDFKQLEDVQEGRWVSFIVKETEECNLDNASDIRRIKICIQDFDVAMKYIEEYECIPGATVNIQRLVTNMFLKKAEGRKIIFDYITSNIFDNNYKGAILHCFQDPRISQLIVNPDEYCVTICNQNKYSYALYVLAITIISTKKNNGALNKSDLDLLMVCISKMSDNLKEQLSLTIDSLLSSTNAIQIKSFLSGLSLFTLIDIFKENKNMSAYARLFIFSKGGDISYVLHDSIVEVWNDKFPLYYSNRYNDHKEEIISYIISSNKASDKLLFRLFLWSSDVRCFNAIRDINQLCWEISQFDYATKGHLVSLLNIIPFDKREAVIKGIGLSTLLRFLKTEDTLLLPENMIVDMVVIINIIADNKRTEEYVRKSRFTWDEGLEEDIDYITYLDKTYSADVFISPSKRIFFGPISDKKRSTINRWIKDCMRLDKPSLFINSTDEGLPLHIVKLSIVDDIDSILEKTQLIMHEDSQTVSIPI